jgi:hypothetical protein
VVSISYRQDAKSSRERASLENSSITHIVPLRSISSTAAPVDYSPSLVPAVLTEERNMMIGVPGLASVRRREERLLLDRLGRTVGAA